MIPEPHDHVVFELSSSRTVVFNDPRRFGVMDLVRTSAGLFRLVDRRSTVLCVRSVEPHGDG